MLLGKVGLLAQHISDDELLAVVVPIYIVAVIVMIVAQWKLFSKAGKPGWASLVPVYNTVVMLEIVGRPTWWILLLLFPCTAPIILVIMAVDLAKSFGKGGGFTVGLILLGIVFFPILAFGSAQYQGPAAAPSE